MAMAMAGLGPGVARGSVRARPPSRPEFKPDVAIERVDLECVALRSDALRLK